MQLKKFIIKIPKNRIGWFSKKREYFENKLKENIAKPKDLWETFKASEATSPKSLTKNSNTVFFLVTFT